MFRRNHALPIQAQRHLSAARLFFGVFGGALAFYGSQRKQGIVGRVASSIGLGLIAKSLGTSFFSNWTDLLAALMAQIHASFPKLLSSSGVEA